jgi:hypothetical protein
MTIGEELKIIIVVFLLKNLEVLVEKEENSEVDCACGSGFRRIIARILILTCRFDTGFEHLTCVDVDRKRKTQVSNPDGNVKCQIIPPKISKMTAMMFRYLRQQQTLTKVHQRRNKSLHQRKQTTFKR